MKRIINVILHLPMIGFLSVYIYAILTMISLGTTHIYSTDPKYTPIGYCYEHFFYYLPLIGYLGIIAGLPHNGL